jgi:hypothetical protein
VFSAPSCGSSVATAPGSIVTFFVTAQDPDPAGSVTLTLNGPGSLTPISTGRSATSRFDWTPSAGDAGTRSVEFVARGACGGEARCAVTIQVTQPVPDNNPPSCANAHAEPSLLWPPNHTMVPISVVGVVDPDGDPVQVEVIRIVQDEPVDNGSHEMDAVIENGNASVRSERDGGGDGRVYELTYRARDARGAECTGKVRVCVSNREDQTCNAGTLAFNSVGVQPPAGVRGSKSQKGTTRPLLPQSQVVSARVVAATGSGVDIEYTLPRDLDVSLVIYDLAGRRVAELEDGMQSAGTHVASWNIGGAVRGMYFYRMRTEERQVGGSFVLSR